MLSWDEHETSFITLGPGPALRPELAHVILLLRLPKIFEQQRVRRVWALAHYVLAQWDLSATLGLWSAYHHQLSKIRPLDVHVIGWLSLHASSGLEVIKPFVCSIALSTKFILLINVKMPTIIGILTFISMINTTSEILEARNFFYLSRF